MNLLRWVVAIGVVMMVGGCAHAAPKCLTYTAAVNLHGKLLRATFPGPPNYEDVRTGDAPETYWVLQLPEPFCVAGQPIDAGIDAAQSNVTEIQLVLTREQYRKYWQKVGRRVRVSGNLFGAHTTHHHTAVLMEHVEFR